MMSLEDDLLICWWGAGDVGYDGPDGVSYPGSNSHPQPARSMREEAGGPDIPRARDATRCEGRPLIPTDKKELGRNRST